MLFLSLAPFLQPWYHLPFSNSSSSLVISTSAAQLVQPFRHLHPGSAARGIELRRIGRRDYAFGADGARIAPELTTGTHHHSANVILRDNLQGGRCWSIPDRSGQVGIVTAERIRPTHITVDHVPREAADDIATAPRHMRVWAYVEGPHRDKVRQFQRSTSSVEVDGPKFTGSYSMFFHIADFEYDVYAQHHIQTFAVKETARAMDLDYGIFVVEVLDNWGREKTCIYRIRIHGHSYNACESLLRHS